MIRGLSGPRITEKVASFYSRRRVSPAKLTLKTTFAGAGYAGTEAVSPGLRFPALRPWQRMEVL